MGHLNASLKRARPAGTRKSRVADTRRSRSHRAGAAVPAVEEFRSQTVPVESRTVEAPQGDAFQLYLREIGRVKLLTPDEERVLARRIQRGDKQAREQMIKANLRLVVKIARDYEGLGLPLLDLISEGNIGLMKGVERFNPQKGAKLSTYASWWIKQSIKRALANQSKTIRLPVHVVDKVAHIRQTEGQLRNMLDRDPTDEEVAEEVGLNARRVRQYREASRATVSLDAPVGDEASATVSESVADVNAAAPYEGLLRNNDQELVQEVLAKLDARESRILALRFGLEDGRPKTLEEVGVLFGVTRERVRQLQVEALQKLRAHIQEREEPASPRVVSAAA